VSDSGWNALAYEGLQAIKADLGAEVNNQEASGTQIKEAMRTYAQQGYNLVIGHGFEFNDPAAEVGKDFPKTVFVTSSGGKFADNVGAFRFYLEQGFYLAGMLAAGISKTHTVAMVGVKDYESIVSTFNAFEAGAKAADPNVKVLRPVYFGTEGDIAGAKQSTYAVMAQGADVVIHQANAAAQGVFDAVKEKGGWALGANANQNENPSGVVIASAVIVAKPAFVELAKQVRDGAYKGAITLVGMDKGNIDFILNPALKDKIPADVQKKIEETKAKIMDGSLVVKKDEF
jgi:basic membrane protein A and related proteins